MTIEKNKIDAALKLLDIQRKYCVDSGAAGIVTDEKILPYEE